MQTFNRLIEALEAEGAGALVSLIKVDGSSPRESEFQLLAITLRRIAWDLIPDLEPVVNAMQSDDTLEGACG